MYMEFNLVHMMIKRVKYWCLFGFLDYTGSTKKMYTHFNERKLYVV